MYRRTADPNWHDIAQICLNGHMINEKTKDSPEFNKKYCDLCGAATITQCQVCRIEIQGYYHVPGVVDLTGRRMSIPAFCKDCGAPYPWTESKLNAAKELVQEFEELNEEERGTLSGSLDDLVKDTPHTPVAAIRFKKLVAKIGKEGAGALRNILVDIATKAAKDTLGLP